MSSESRQLSIRLPRPLWIVIATVALTVTVAGVRIGVPIYQQRCAIDEVAQLGGIMSLRPVGPQWLRQRVSEEWMAVFDEVESIRFQPDRATFGRRFSGLMAGGRAWTTGPTIDDATLACVAKLPDLKRLDLSWTNVSDAGVEHISRLQKLEILRLNGTDVSDESIPLLARLRNLKELSIWRTAVTEQGAGELQRGWSACHVTAGPRPVHDEEFAVESEANKDPAE